MSFQFFVFGQVKPEFAVPVVNERAVRAGAGILFFFAMVAFMNAWLSGNFAPTRVFVLAFLFDFVVRLFINPAYAPSLVIGQWLVRNQQPEWTGAPQKRFAWAIGLVLALTMWVTNASTAGLFMPLWLPESSWLAALLPNRSANSWPGLLVPP